MGLACAVETSRAMIADETQNRILMSPSSASILGDSAPARTKKDVLRRLVSGWPVDLVRDNDLLEAPGGDLTRAAADKLPIRATMTNVRNSSILIITLQKF